MRRAVHADHQAARIALGTMMIEVCVAVCCGVLRCVAVCCSLLQKLRALHLAQ